MAILATTSPSFTWRPSGPWQTSQLTVAWLPFPRAWKRSSWQSAQERAPPWSGGRAAICSGTFAYR